MEPGESTLPVIVYTWIKGASTETVFAAFWSVVLGGLFLFSLVRWWVCRERVRAAERATSRSPVLRPGFTILTGRVDTENCGAAIELAVREKLTTHIGRRPGEMRIDSLEVGRSVVAKPFYLVLADETRVRVEPDGSVFLVGKLVERELSTGERTRAATLEDGELATVSGVLRRGHDPRAAGMGYRASGEALILVPPDDERMMVSAEPLPARHRRRAILYARYVFAFGIGLILLRLVPPFYLGTDIVGVLSVFLATAIPVWPIHLYASLPWYDRKRLSDSSMSMMGPTKDGKIDGSGGATNESLPAIWPGEAAYL